MNSASENVGPHLLGRKPSPPDARDWSVAKLAEFEHQRKQRVRPDDPALQRLREGVGYAPTDAEIAAQVRQIHVWHDIYALWAWIKSWFSGPPQPPPQPPPGPGAPPWEDLIQLDQGQTPHCVGFGWAAWGNAAPPEDHLANADGDAIYYACKVIDGEPRAEDGSYVRSGAKAMQQRSRLTAYAFANSTDEVRQWVQAKGPVVIGSDWTNDMFNPDSSGLVKPTGGVAGGHCYLMLGYDASTQRFQFDNSWGSGWGKSGRFFMNVSDFDKLVMQSGNGEACVALELP